LRKFMILLRFGRRIGLSLSENCKTKVFKKSQKKTPALAGV